MTEVVISEESEKVFEIGLRNVDSKGLTLEGIVNSYKIDYDSIDHNSMRG